MASEQMFWGAPRLNAYDVIIDGNGHLVGLAAAAGPVRITGRKRKGVVADRCGGRVKGRRTVVTGHEFGGGKPVIAGPRTRRSRRPGSQDNQPRKA